MAKLSKAQKLKVAVSQLIRRKTAELDGIDDQLVAMDSTMPMGETNQKFDLLAEKREELEADIRKMREQTQLLTEWEKFKNGDWSEQIKAELNNLDQQFASMADESDMGMDMGGGMPPMDAGLGVPPAGAPPIDTTPVDSPDLDAAPLPAPTASKKTNYQPPTKKDATKGDTHMANQNSKQTSIKEKLAEAKSTREAIAKEARTRVASAWTIAKTMLPGAPVEAQKAFASTLLTSSTKVLKAALKQTAINAHSTKLAADFKNVHKKELNEFITDGEDLKDLRSAVKSELNGSPLTASKKTADDTKECGEQPAEYKADGRTEPKEIDGSKADLRKEPGQRPGDTINLSEGKNAAKKKHASCTSDCKGKGCDNCLEKSASVKTADEAPVAPPVAPPAAEAAPVDAPPAEAPVPPMEAAPEEAAGEIITDETKMVLEEKIDEISEAVKGLETELHLEQGEEISDEIPDLLGGEGEDASVEFGEEDIHDDGEGEGELDFSKVFDNDQMDEKVSSLANEDDEKTAGEEEDDFFTPRSAAEAEEDLNKEAGFDTIASFFDLAGSNSDPLASLMGSVKSAAQVAGIDVVPSSNGEAAKKFENTEAEADSRDSENDHEQDLWAEAIESIEPESAGQKRIPQDSKNKLEAPKKATLRQIKNVKASADDLSYGDALFNDGFDM